MPENAAEWDRTLDAPSSVRNRPMQGRSRALLERVLASAGVAFDELGVPSCTMEEVARRAGVSVGAAYRFFPNKRALAQGLAERYAAQHLAAILPLFSPDSIARPADEMIGEFFATFSALVARQPGWQNLSRAGYLFTTGPDAHTEWDGPLQRFLAAQVPGLRPAARRRAARTLEALTGWLLIHAIESGAQVRQGLRDAEIVVVGYIHELRRRNP